MKILMITPAYYPIKGGTETIVRNLSLKLNFRGIQTDVMTFNMTNKWHPKWSGKIDKIDESTIYKIPALNWQPIEHSVRTNFSVNLIPGKFQHVLKNYDIIHYHEFDLSFPLFSYFVKKPKIFHLHGLDADYIKRYHITRLLFNNISDYYVAISKIMRDDLIAIGVPKRNLLYLPNGIDTKRFCPKNEKEEKLLLFVGRIVPEKGLDVLLKSLSYIDTPVKLVVVGPFSPSSYWDNIQKLAEKVRLAGKHTIDFLGGIDPEETIRWYQKASIFILPSFTEGLPVVVLEALSCETPVVATPVGGIPDIITDFKTGLFVPPGNSQKVAEKIQYLLDNDAVRIKMGQEGRKRIVSAFSLDSLIENLILLYKRIILS